MNKMGKDKKFIVAVVIIIILVLALLYLLLLRPSFQGYIVKQQISAQQSVVKAVLDVVDQQGFISLTDGNRSVVLVKYAPPAQDVPAG